EGAGLGIGEPEIDADGRRAGRLQPGQRAGEHRTAPRPAADLADARVVDQHQRDVVRAGGLGAQSETQIEQLRLDLLDGPRPTGRQVAEAEGERRQQGDAKRRQPRLAPDSGQKSVAQGTDVRSMNALRRASPQTVGAGGGVPASTVTPSPGPSVTSPGTAGSTLRTATSPPSDTIAVAARWTSAIHSVPRTEITAVLVCIS